MLQEYYIYNLAANETKTITINEDCILLAIEADGVYNGNDYGAVVINNETYSLINTSPPRLYDKSMIELHYQHINSIQVIGPIASLKMTKVGTS